MCLRLITLSVLIFGFFCGSRELQASPSAQGISQSEGAKNENEILKYLLPALKSSGKAGRIYYLATCQPDDKYPIPFPQIRVQPPSRSKAGLAAIREIFQNEKNVRVTEDRPGVISIWIGDVPDAILHTNISFLTLKPIAQYNYPIAFAAIEKSKEVRSAMLELGLRVPPTLINEILVQPAEGLPHLPSTMTNVTMDKALDLAAITFRGVVIYGACTEPRLYRIDFTGGVYFDDSKLSGGEAKPKAVAGSLIK
jgi:hypothetical protein